MEKSLVTVLFLNELCTYHLCIVLTRPSFIFTKPSAAHVSWIWSQKLPLILNVKLARMNHRGYNWRSTKECKQNSAVAWFVETEPSDTVWLLYWLFAFALYAKIYPLYSAQTVWHFGNNLVSAQCSACPREHFMSILKYLRA